MVVHGAIPEHGHGALDTLARLTGPALDGTIASAGPRNFHFVTGGVTPAALGADWLASVLDQNAFALGRARRSARSSSASRSPGCATCSGCPPEWGGVLTTGATMANFAALAAARHWWAARHGVDVERGRARRACPRRRS